MYALREREAYENALRHDGGSTHTLYTSMSQERGQLDAVHPLQRAGERRRDPERV